MRLSFALSAVLASTLMMVGCSNHNGTPGGKTYAISCGDNHVDLTAPKPKRAVLCPGDRVHWTDNASITITFTGGLSPFTSGQTTFSSASGDVMSDEANDPLTTEWYPYTVVEHNKDGSEKTLPENHVIVLGGGGIVTK
jgi:hypothetical protein